MTTSNTLPTDITPSSTTSAPRHYHFMGVGGIGLSAFARLLKARGHTVSGCDEHPSELTAELQKEGIEFSPTHSPAHVQQKIDVLVASEAIAKDHPEILAARAAGIQVQPRMQLLQELLAGVDSVGVIGTHGKTTTTSMVAIAMQGAGLDPSAFVGGLVPEFGGNARVGTGPLVAEVDESDRKFQHITLQTAIFTNAEDDHIGGPEGSEVATYWNSVEEQHAAFAQVVRQAERVLYCADWDGLEVFVEGHPEALSYGLKEGSTYQARNVKADTEGSSFEVHHQGQKLLEARINLPGLHNVQNALAALAVTHIYGGNLTAGAAALAQFRGPGRRWQHIGTLNGALVIDDYAHNATKVAAAISAAHQTERRVRVIFQPHRYLRTKQSWPKLADSLMQADEVLLLDIAAASETPIEGIHATLISDKMKAQGHEHITYYPQRGDVVEYLRATAQPTDIILTMGAGDVWKLARELVQV